MTATMTDDERRAALHEVTGFEPVDASEGHLFDLDHGTACSAKCLACAKAEDQARVEALTDRLRAGQIGNILPGAIERMRRRAEGVERPISLPWPTVNAAIGGGLWPGLHIFVGTTGTGKSTWALQAAARAARDGVPVLYIGLELGPVDVSARLMGLGSKRHAWSSLYLGRETHPADGMPAIERLLQFEPKVVEDLAAFPLHLEFGDPLGWSYTKLRELAVGMRALYPLATDEEGRPIPGSRPFLVVLDFLQLASAPDGERLDARQVTGRAAYAGRSIARDLDAAVLMVSSTARENYTKLEKQAGGAPPWTQAPQLLVGLGKESGEVEYSADDVLVMLRDGEQAEDGSVWMHLAVAKLRAGPPDWVALKFNGHRFLEPTREDLQRMRAAAEDAGGRLQTIARLKVAEFSAAIATGKHDDDLEALRKVLQGMQGTKKKIQAVAERLLVLEDDDEDLSEKDLAGGARS